MRSDLRDVLITRGRGGGWKKRKGRRRPLEELPLREPIDRRGTKWFRDLLGPLKRFFTARLGQRWDDVWSELCGALDRRGLLQQHVFVHAAHMVAVNVLAIDGRLHTVTERGIRPLRSGRWRDAYYVDPDTGRLRRAPDLPR